MDNSSANINASTAPDAPPAAPKIKIDFGCGPNKKEGFVGVDRIAFPGVDHVVDLAGAAPWPFEPESVEEAQASHFVEHLDAIERIAFFNNLYRVLVPKGKALIITPHWCASRAYGDPTHKWPPVAEFGWFYLEKEWRMKNAPHTDREHWPLGYDCDFAATWGYGMNPSLQTRNVEFQQMALNYYKEAAQDMHATLIKK